MQEHRSPSPESILNDKELRVRVEAECAAQGISVAIPAHALGPIARLLRSTPAVTEGDGDGEDPSCEA
jgi:hypothetical protein